MLLMFAGLVVFLGSHLVPAFPNLREPLRARLGENAYKGLFSLVALVGLVALVWGYGIWRAEGPPQIYVPATWMRHLTLLLMLPVFPLLVAAYAPAGRIKAAVRHPMILAVKIWAFAHLFANGDLASLILFFGFLAWGVIDRLSLKRREAAGLVTVDRSGPARNDVVPVVLGLAVYGLFVWRLHMWLIGVPVLY